MTVIENAWDPVPVDAERAERNRRRLITDMRRRDPGWQWNGPQIPENMPAYDNLYGGNDGRVWVLRTADTERLSDCDPDILAPQTGRESDCWRNIFVYDVFRVDGRFMGTVANPPNSVRTPVFRGDHIISYVEDEAGLGMVKRYRLVLPGER